MSRELYQEPFLSYAEQMNLLKNRGLSFKDETQVLSLFQAKTEYFIFKIS